MKFNNNIFVCVFFLLFMFCEYTKGSRTTRLDESDESSRLNSSTIQILDYSDDKSSIISLANNLVGKALEDNQDRSCCSKCFCPENSSCASQGIRYSSFLIGTAAAVWTFNAGKEFWIHQTNNQIASYILSGVGALPLLALRAKLTRDKFEDLYNSIVEKSKYNHVIKNITIIDAATKGASFIINITGGFCFGTGLTYLTYKYYYPLISNWSIPLLIVPTAVSLVASGYWGVDKTITQLSDFISSKYYEIKLYINPMFINENIMIMRIINKIELIKNYMSKKDDLEISSLFSAIRSSEYIQHLIANTVVSQTETNAEKVVRYSVGMCGWGLGSLGVWSLKPLTVVAMHELLPIFGSNDPYINKVVSEAVGWGSFTVFSLLTGYITKNVFSQMYQYSHSNLSDDLNREWDKTDKLKAGLNIALFIISGLSAVPRTEVTIKYMADIFVLKPVIIACTALSSFLLDYWAMAHFVNPDSYQEPKLKTKILECLDKLLLIVPKLNSENIERLYKLDIEALNNPGCINGLNKQLIEEEEKIEI